MDVEILQGFLGLGINVKDSRENQKVECPNCAKIGKTHLRDKCLSVNIHKGLYNCHKCSWSGGVVKHKMQQTYKLPEKKNITGVSDDILVFFANRGITQEVVKANKIAMSKDGQNIIFPYIRNEVFTNYKSRNLKEKDFRQAYEAEAIIFNYDRVIGQKKVIITEGELDSMAFEVAGFTNHTSVNQGAPNAADKNIEKKLECITNCYEVFDGAEVVYIAVDADDNGLRLQKELIRRFGAEKCKIVDFEDCKDANEYLVKYGADKLADTISFAKDVQIDGVFSIENVFESMLSGFKNGLERGQTTYIEEVDKAWKWRKGEVTLWTGYQNEGKSLFLNQLSLIKSYIDGDKFAVFSPENMPMDDFFNDLIEMLIGKTVDKFYGNLQMDEEEYTAAATFINERFYLIYPDFDFKIETIFIKTLYLIRKKGIQHLIIDPYNTIEHMIKGGEREDLYISRFMSMLKRFAVENGISVHLVAHQLTARKNKDDGDRYFKPDLNHVKGGGTFADKADNVCFVWRPDRAIDFRSTKVVFGSQKIKKQKLVARPCEIDCIDFDYKSNRYLFNGNTIFKTIDESFKDFKKSFYADYKEKPPIEYDVKTDEIDYNNNDEILF